MMNTRLNLGLFSLAFVALGGLTVLGDQKPAAPDTKALKRAAADVGKAAVERPAREIVAKGASAVPTEAMINAPLKLAAASPENPKTQPGLVRWHADFNAARAASIKSGKPVLLFHMMGRLDDLFC